jgi:hypothetical protein
MANERDRKTATEMTVEEALHRAFDRITKLEKVADELIIGNAALEQRCFALTIALLRDGVVGADQLQGIFSDLADPGEASAAEMTGPTDQKLMSGVADKLRGNANEISRIIADPAACPPKTRLKLLQGGKGEESEE